MNIVAADNRTPIVNVLTWFLLTAAVLSVITRLGTKYFIRGRLSPDDYIICVSLVRLTLESMVHRLMPRLALLRAAVHLRVRRDGQSLWPADRPDER